MSQLIQVFDIHTELPESGGYLTNSGKHIKMKAKHMEGGRTKRYSTMKYKWHHLNLTYRIGIYSRSINNDIYIYIYIYIYILNITLHKSYARYIQYAIYTDIRAGMV